MPTRRDLMQTLGLTMGVGFVASALPFPQASAQESQKPFRLRTGDTIGLIEPASASDEPFDITLVEETVRALGLVPKRGRNLLARDGYFAGKDRDRAADVNAMFADPDVRAILAVRGGWGAARILPYLDWKTIRANPKLLIGYSDITALHMAIQARAGFMTLHGPVGVSSWGKVSVESFKQLAFEGAMPTFRNPLATEDRLVQRKWRTQVIRGGKAEGRLLGGNLTVLTALVGTPWLPKFDNAILFLEDIDEAEYRIDRMLTQLGQAGILARLKGVVFGQCNNCRNPSTGSYGGFTLSSVLNQHFGPLGIPAFQGAFFGHMPDQYSIPVGAKAMIDADAGTLTMLEPIVV